MSELSVQLAAESEPFSAEWLCRQRGGTWSWDERGGSPGDSMELGPRLLAVTLASAQMGRSDILQLSSCSLPCSPFSDTLGLTLCQVDLSILVGNFFFPLW